MMNIELMLRPLEGNSGPCGEEMGFSSEFDAIQEARRFDDPSLSQGEWITEVKEADWGKVIQICEDLLARRTKDIRVTVWLIEAQAKARGAATYQRLAAVCALAAQHGIDGFPDIMALAVAAYSTGDALHADGQMASWLGKHAWETGQFMDALTAYVEAWEGETSGNADNTPENEESPS